MKQENNEKTHRKISYGSFNSINLPTNLQRAIVHKGYRIPTPIQRKCIPILREGQDLVAMARTGSGKTAAFVIPMIEKLRNHSIKVGIRALVVAPTRELALQTIHFIKDLSKYSDLRYSLVVGGDSMDDQFSSLLSNPDILVGTPGRILHIIEEAKIDLSTIEFLVLDEGDRLFELGFAAQITQLLHLLPPTRQTAIFSATLPANLFEFAKSDLKNPVLIRLDTDVKISQDLDLFFFYLKPETKEPFLLTLLEELVTKRKESTIIFTATKHHVEYLSELLKAFNIKTACVYGTLDQEARTEAVDRFKNRQVNVLVVTDVASRGIDIPLLDNVINYDFPDNTKLFVHRVGRAGRAGRQGKAYSFVTAEEVSHFLELQLFLGKRLIYQNENDNQKKEKKQSNLAKLNFNYREDMIIGEVTSGLLEENIEALKKKRELIADLSSMKRTCENAYKMYHKTKMSSSPESFRRAKKILHDGIFVHPILFDLFSGRANVQSGFLEELRKFKPSQTIFEVTATKQRGARKRAIPSKTIQNRRVDEEKSLISGAFKDEGFYLSYTPKNQSDRLMEKAYSFADKGRAAVFDIGMDEPLMNNQSNRQVWDKKKKKFVKIKDHSETIRLKEKRGSHSDESRGGKPVEKGVLFSNWKRKIGIDVPRAGQPEIQQTQLEKIIPKKRKIYR